MSDAPAPAGVPDMVRLQQQIRTNTADLQEFVADLGKWESEIQKKDSQLKTLVPAEKEKEKGSAAFAAGKYEEAIACYTRSLEIHPQNAIVFANRAMAYLKLNKFAEAESDCDKSILLDKKYAKAYARRAMARRGQKRYQEAVEDFEHCLMLEPGHKPTMKELEQTRALLAERAAARKINIVEVEEEAVKPAAPVTAPAATAPTAAKQAPTPASAAQPAPSQPATAPISVPIQIAPEQATPAAKPATVPAAAPTKQPETKPTTGTGTAVPASAAVTASAAAAAGSAGVGAAKGTAAPAARTSAPPAPAPAAAAPQLAAPTAPPAPAPAAPTAGIRSPTGGRGVVSPAVLSSIKPTLPTQAPRTAYEFERVWNELREDAALQYAYLRLCEAVSYRALFREAMDSDLFGQILSVLQAHTTVDNAAFARHVLESMALVPRFDTNVRFLSRPERERVAALFATLQSAGGAVAADLAPLRDKYVK